MTQIPVAKKPVAGFPELNALNQKNNKSTNELLTGISVLEAGASRTDSAVRAMNEAPRDKNVTITEIHSIDMNFDPKERFTATPMIISETVDNTDNNSVAQKNITLTHTLSKTSTFSTSDSRVNNIISQTSNGSSQSSDASASAKVSIPILTDWKIEAGGGYKKGWGHHQEQLFRMEESCSHQVSFGQSKREDINISKTISVQVPAGCKKRVELKVYHVDKDIPFTAKVGYSNGEIGMITGTWRGTLVTDAETKISELASMRKNK